ncbi:MAG: diguanylate cyclase [Pseudomonadota bacterium]
MPRTDAGLAESVAGRLRETISTLRVPDAAGGMPGFVVSIGLAELSGPHESVSSVLLRADRALHQAKRSGRNRVIAAAREQA